MKSEALQAYLTTATSLGRVVILTNSRLGQVPKAPLQDLPSFRRLLKGFYPFKAFLKENDRESFSASLLGA